jgi:DNA polymerase-3 subunit delta'|tara:strand:+ start:691 stop:1830 length:1140 start_codon:yes stop_codon:yes gene_type:complete
MLFKDVVGHSKLKTRLIETVKNGRISHAQLFLGKEGGGNFQLALAYAQLINCLSPSESDSCDKCSSCVKYNNLQHPDLTFFFPSASSSFVKEKPSSKKLTKVWIDFVKENQYFNLSIWGDFMGIENKQAILNKEDSLDIIKSFALKNYEAKYKVVIIWWPEKMNIDCSNKILKVLEEPNPNSIFLLVGHNSDELLATIISRVQIINIGELTDKDIEQGLIDKEGLPVDLAQSLSSLSGGSFFEAIQQLKNPDGDKYFIDIFQRWMRLCYSVDFLNLNKLVDEIAKKDFGREKQKKFLEYGMRIFRECIVYNYASKDLNRLHDKEAIFNSKFAQFIHGGNILELIDVFEHTHTGIIRNANPKIAFMNLSLKVCNFLKYKV